MVALCNYQQWFQIATMPAKSDLSLLNCSLARALGAVGDWWSLLIVRDAVLGATRFVEFQQSSGIARNILASRLAALVVAGVLDRRGKGARPTYHLTTKGQALVPSLIALTQWGDAWESGGVAPIIFSDLSGDPIESIGLMTSTGARTNPESIAVQPGPGATTRTRAYLSHFKDKTRST
jgi:DNA-binding HxlR family transcriptional regulator